MIDTPEIMDAIMYGLAKNDNYFDVKDILGSKLFDYRIKKIKCQLKKDTSIYGIQLFYENINDGSIKTVIDIKSNEKDLIDQEFELDNEVITVMNVWLNDDISLIGFEITTDKGRIFKFGYGNDHQLVKSSYFKENQNIIVGFGFYFDGESGITAIYGK